MAGWVDLFRRALGWYSSGGAEEVIDVGTPGTAAGIRLALGLYESPTGPQLADLSHAVVCDMDKGEHGYRSLTCFIPCRLEDAFRYYDQAPGKHLVLGNGAAVAWEGRIEDRAIVGGGLRLKAFGYWRALKDAPYTALWSDASTASYDVATDVASERFQMDNNNRIYIAPKKGGSFGSTDVGRYQYQTPDGGGRDIVGIQFDYELVGASPWTAQVRDASFSSLWSLVGNGTTRTGCVNITFTATDTLYLQFYRNTTADYTGETGDTYIKITNVRVVTSSANRVNTTTATTISAGSQEVTPASMTGIRVGQRLFIAQGAATSESVVVTAVTSTTFAATFSNSYSGTTTIHAHVVYADEIAKDLVSHIDGLGNGHLSSSTALIQSPQLDLLDEVYEDEYPADILTYLAALGDNQSPPRRWETGVMERRMLYFRPKGGNGRNWQVDLDEPDIDSTLETLYNSAYVTYQDENGRVLRTAVANNAASQDKYGLTRRAMLAVRTTSATQAGTHRDALLSDKAVITPRSQMAPRWLFGESGAPYPKWLCDPGDVITARDLPPTISASVDNIRRFMVSEMTYDAIEDELQPVPGDPEASLDFLVARREEGIA